MELVAEHVSKSIKGRPILRDINIELKNSRVYGFTGRNGSGKTMLFRALSGLMKIDGGRICCDGMELHKQISVLPNLGITLENAGVYPEFSGIRNLKLLADVRKKIGVEEIRSALIRVGLDPDDRRPCRKYSLGMKQRIAIAQAIMEKPDILMLDEPTNSLDEQGIQMLRCLINEERNRGAMILLASHSREDLELLADEIFSMSEGRLRRGGSDAVK